MLNGVVFGVFVILLILGIDSHSLPYDNDNIVRVYCKEDYDRHMGEVLNCLYKIEDRYKKLDIKTQQRYERFYKIVNESLKSKKLTHSNFGRLRNCSIIYTDRDINKLIVELEKSFVEVEKAFRKEN